MLTIEEKILKFYKKSFGWECKKFVFINKSKPPKLILGVLTRKNEFISLPHFSYGLITTDISYESLNKENDSVFFVNQDHTLECSNKKLVWEIRSLSKLSKYYNDSKVVNYINLQDSIDNQLKWFSTSIRSNLKKAQRYNHNVAVGSHELIDDFYFVYSKNMHRLGSPAYSKGFFKDILEIFNDSIILVIYSGNDAIACSFLIKHKKIIEMCWASSLSKYNFQNVNYTLYWESIKYAITNDCNVFSFGRSTKDSSSYRFKHHWNPKEVKLYFNFSKEKLNIRDYKFLSYLWRKLPYFIAVRLGPKLIRYIY